MLQAMTLVQQPELRFVLAPELRQSLRLLQMPAVDLAAHIREQESENPLMEVIWPEERERGGRSAGRMRGEARESRWTIEHRARDTETLEQALLAQLRLTNASREAIRVAGYLAGNLDGSGYLALGLEEAAACLGVSTLQAEEGLRLLHSCEPAGVGARSLAECLLLQVRRDPLAPRLCEGVIERHLPDVARGRWLRIGQSLSATSGEIEDAVRYMRRLEPRPGSAYGFGEDSRFVVPEARLSMEGGHPCIRMNRAFLPRVRVASRTWTNEAGATPEWRRQAEGKRKEARLLAEGIAFRLESLHAVILALAEEQAAFFLRGPQAIRPLKLEDLAARTGYHPSTVSRAVRDKFVDTPFGIAPLSRFLAVGLDTEHGERVSSRSVKHRIRALIKAERADCPLSDCELAEVLRREGVRISRRTVAKYREEERLLPSTLRGRMEAGDETERG
ncbi:RNA polymerase factor sigma-54 [Cohnella boryungensis]|uniref:RNA polymerase factor sigma-54 n=1 Tax=Cohnella boryungensis TaxID=768479 RepID=A0ABV8SDP0_9BACL